METEKPTVTLGSLFDGIGGFPHAGTFFGIVPVWASEVMGQAVSVTMRHFPHMEHVGDICQLDGAMLAPVDIITFGSPCQDLSVAGRRAGLVGERSGLFSEAVRIIDEMRRKTNGKYPSYAVWENVPGALSSAGGRDFASVLEAFAKTKIPVPVSGRWAGAGMVRGDGVSVAWRVLNACLWGVPQRRRRIFLVADFTGGCASEVLFVEKGMRGHPAPGGQARKGVAADACRGALGPVRSGMRAFSANQRDEVRDLGMHSGALAAQPGMKLQTFIAEGCLTPSDVQSRRIHPEDSQWPAMYSAKSGGHGYAAVHTDCLNPWDTQQARVSTGGGAAPTLSGSDGGGGRNPAGLVLAPQEEPGSRRPAAVFLGGAGSSAGGVGYSESISPTLRAGSCGFAAPCVCEPKTARTLVARGDSSPCADRGQNVVAVLPAVTMRVREGCDQHLFAPAPAHKGQCGDTPVPDAAYALQGSMIGRRSQNGPGGSGVSKDLSFTLTAADVPGVAALMPIPIHDRATRHKGGGATRDGDGSGNGLGVGEAGGPAPTLTSGDHHSVATFNRQRSDSFKEQDVASTQAARQCKDATDIVCEDTSAAGRKGPAHAGYIVRRLTPTECERLQGFPDGWTRLGAAGEEMSDTRRYQMLGNSVAIPCVAFVLGNIAAQMDETALGNTGREAA